MRWRVPRFGIFLMVVLIVMVFGLLLMGEDENGETGVETPPTEDAESRR